MDVVGRVKEITEGISGEMTARKDKLAADAKDAIRTLAKCVTELVDRAERGTLTKVDEDLDGLAADVTRKMGRISLGNEEAQRAKKLLGAFQEEVLAIRTAKPESSRAMVDPDRGLVAENTQLTGENAELKEENTNLEKDLASVHDELSEVKKNAAEVQKDLDDVLAGPSHVAHPEEPPKTPAAKGGKKTEPAKKPAAEPPKAPVKPGEKTPEQEAEAQAGAGEGKKGDAKK